MDAGGRATQDTKGEGWGEGIAGAPELHLASTVPHYPALKPLVTHHSPPHPLLEQPGDPPRQPSTHFALLAQSVPRTHDVFPSR